MVTLLSYLRIRCQLVDFHRPTGPGGTHPDLFKWVLNYFENSVGGEFTPPLYLQHQGNNYILCFVDLFGIKKSKLYIKKYCSSQDFWQSRRSFSIFLLVIPEIC